VSILFPAWISSTYAPIKNLIERASLPDGRRSNSYQRLPYFHFISFHPLFPTFPPFFPNTFNTTLCFFIHSYSYSQQTSNIRHRWHTLLQRPFHIKHSSPLRYNPPNSQTINSPPPHPFFNTTSSTLTSFLHYRKKDVIPLPPSFHNLSFMHPPARL